MDRDRRRHPRLGWLLVVLGVVGILAVVVPFIAFPGWIPSSGSETTTRPAGVALSLEWYVLSSAMGAYLGVLLIWAGAGWIGGRPWARMATWAYVTCGATVNATDLAIFLVVAAPSATRTLLIVGDGVCLAIPLALACWLIRRREKFDGSCEKSV